MERRDVECEDEVEKQQDEDKDDEDARNEMPGVYARRAPKGAPHIEWTSIVKFMRPFPPGIWPD
jgi:hypothetical protein